MYRILSRVVSECDSLFSKSQIKDESQKVVTHLSPLSKLISFLANTPNQLTSD